MWDAIYILLGRIVSAPLVILQLRGSERLLSLFLEVIQVGIWRQRFPASFVLAQFCTGHNPNPCWNRKACAGSSVGEEQTWVQLGGKGFQSPCLMLHASQIGPIGSAPAIPGVGVEMQRSAIDCSQLLIKVGMLEGEIDNSLLSPPR